MIQYRENEGVGIMQIDRPEALNALSREIVDEIDALLCKLAESKTLRVLIVGGTEHFAAGADIKGMVDCDPKGARAFGFSPTYDKLAALAVPTIAAMGGYALGGGLELALCCDLRIAADSAKLGLPETNLGIMPGAGGNVRLPRLVGEAKALELILFGKQISAQDALDMGLVNTVVPQAELMDTAVKWAQKLAKRAPVALQTAKRTVRKAMSCPTVEEGIEYETEEWCGLFTTEDQKEGMRAFIEKRKPAFTGK